MANVTRKWKEGRERWEKGKREKEGGMKWGRERKKTSSAVKNAFVDMSQLRIVSKLEDKSTKIFRRT